MKTVFEAYGDKAIILVVYIREAHPAHADQTAENAGWKVIEGKVFHQPRTYDERLKLAETACTFWELPIPALVDTMEPSIGALYRAWPNRLYVLNSNGKIVYRGVKGPRGVNVHEGELELRKLLGITEGDPLTKPLRKPRSSGGRGRLGSRGPHRSESDRAAEKPLTPDPAPDPASESRTPAEKTLELTPAQQ